MDCSSRPSYFYRNEIYNTALVEHRRIIRRKKVPKLLVYFEYDVKKNKSLFKIMDNRFTSDDPNEDKTRNKRGFKRGFVCGSSGGMEVIVDYYNILSNENKTKDNLLSNQKVKKKELLCNKLLEQFFKKDKEEKNKQILSSIIDTKLLIKKYL